MSPLGEHGGPSRRAVAASDDPGSAGHRHADHDATPDRHNASDQDAAVDRHNASDQDTTPDRHNASDRDTTPDRHNASDRHVTTDDDAFQAAATPARGAANRAPTSDPFHMRAEVRWTAAMLWLIGVVPSAGLGILLLGGRTSLPIAGALGVVIFSLMAYPLARVAVVRALDDRTPQPLPSSDDG